MITAEKARQNLLIKGWNLEQVAEKFGVSVSTARGYKNGTRKIPEKYRPLIPNVPFKGDTNSISREKKEKRINELKKFSIPVPFKN